MEKFKDELLVESSGKKWILRRGFKFYYENHKTGYREDVIIPEKFITDFASTPRIFYPVFPPIGIYNKAAMVHDYLYSVDCKILVSRIDADLFFLQAMEVLGVKKWKRFLMFYAVRIFGRKHFRKNGQRNKRTIIKPKKRS